MERETNGNADVDVDVDANAGGVDANDDDDGDDTAPEKAAKATTSGADPDWRAQFEAASAKNEKLKRKMVRS